MQAVTEKKSRKPRQKKEKPILAWHFIEKDMTTSRGGLPVRVGETLSVEGDLIFCENGLHASVNLLDALNYAQACMLCRVEVWGDVQHDTDKIVGRYRKVLWALDIETLLHEYACDIVEEVLLDERKCGREPDPADWEAVACKRRWVKGQATDKELETAYLAAYRAADRAAYLAADLAADRTAYLAADRIAYLAADRAADRTAYLAAREDFNRRLEARVMELHVLAETSA